MEENKYYTNEQLALLAAVKFSKGQTMYGTNDVVLRAETFLKWLEEKTKK